MVSWRGVAKKRREQEAGGRLTKCSVVVAARQQSWRRGNPCSRLGLLFRRLAASGPRARAQRKANQNRNRDSSAFLPMRRSRLQVAKITTPDINRVRSRSRHFCAAGTFRTRFRHATMCPTTYMRSVERSFIRKTKQRRAQFVAEGLTAVGSGGRAEAQVAEMPFASPYCPQRAQIRRAHVQSRTRFAVLPSMRVGSHASRLARAHHLTIPKIRGGRLSS